MPGQAKLSRYVVQRDDGTWGSYQARDPGREARRLRTQAEAISRGSEILGNDGG